MTHLEWSERFDVRIQIFVPYDVTNICICTSKSYDPSKGVKIAFFDFWQKKSTVILNMLGVEFEKNKNVTFLIYNEGTFFSKKDFQLHSSFNS